MRKTGLTRSRSRRKTTQNGLGTPDAPNDAIVPPPPAAGAPAPTNVAPNDQPRRKPTQEEAALTAKNYRLAKELSELRVRHRDETKAVTRLTMENMNLASRCREALSHVAMLKKELAMHQRRAAEALALQRQQSQRMSEHGDETVSALDRDRSAPIASPPPPPPKESSSQPSKHPPLTPQDNQYTYSNTVLHGEQEPATTLGHSEKSTVPTAAANTGGDSRTLPVSQRPDFDAVSHDLGMTRMPDVMSSISLKPDAFMDDVPADEMMSDRNSSDSGRDSLDLFSGKSALPVTPEKETLEDDSTPSFGNLEGLGRYSQPQTSGKDGDSSEKKLKSSGLPIAKVNKNQEGSSTMSSIDAFEASFDTTFPVSFSTPSDEPPPSLDIAFDVPEFSDPFFLGSHDGGEGNASSPFVQSSPIRTPGKQSIFSQEPEGDGEGLPRISTGEAAEKGSYQGSHASLGASSAATGDGGGVAGKLPSFDLFPSSAMSTFEQHVSSTPTKRGDPSSKSNQGYSGDSFFRTPPVYPDSFVNASAQEVPPLPREKAGAAEARARYDAALGENVPAREKIDQENQQQQVKATKDTSHGGPTKSESSHTPSLVLKRLQQRRAREKGGSNPSTSPTKTSSDAAGAKFESRTSSRRSLDGDSDSNAQRAAVANGDYGPKIRRSNSNSSAGGDASKGRGGTPGKLSPDAMGEEMRQLDAIATASSGQLSEPASVPSNQSSDEPPGGRRRNVKQPVSYAEPALNKKLRRGDVYFPKKDSAKAELTTGDENGTIQVISPASGPELVDEIDMNLLQTTSAEDVLKDLAENTSALKI